MCSKPDRPFYFSDFLPPELAGQPEAGSLRSESTGDLSVDNPEQAPASRQQARRYLRKPWLPACVLLVMASSSAMAQSADVSSLLPSAASQQHSAHSDSASRAGVVNSTVPSVAGSLVEEGASSIQSGHSAGISGPRLVWTGLLLLLMGFCTWMGREPEQQPGRCR